MKILKTLSIILVMTLMLSACGVALKGSDYTAVEIVLDDEKITVDGKMPTATAITRFMSQTISSIMNRARILNMVKAMKTMRTQPKKPLNIP